jgi:hypothetical protein
LIEHDKKQFKAMMTALTVLYGKRDLDQELLRIWYGKLKRFDVGMVSKAFDKWVDNNKYMPLPVDIIELCKAQEQRVFNVALPKPAHTPEQVQQNKDRLEKEIAKLKPKTDHKKWAKDILKEAEEGLYKFDMGIKFAKEALGIKA